MSERIAAEIMQAPGGNIGYEHAGRGPSIVLLHEGIADRRMWDREFSTLATSHHVIRYDLRGFGGSSPATARFSYVEDLATLIDHLHLERPVIVGPSMGGRIAIDFTLAHPDRVGGLLLIAPGLSGMKIEYDPEGQSAFDVDDRESAAIATAWKEGRHSEAEELLRKLWASALQGPGLELFRKMVRENSLEIFEDRSGQFDHAEAPPAATRLREVHVPTSVLVGDRDNPSSPRFAMYVARSIPEAKLTEVPGADHLLNLSAPAAFDAALFDLLARVSK
ncbi:MAG: alpha/beta fold hydrolase [Thermoplasmata archaeon]